MTKVVLLDLDVLIVLTLRHDHVVDLLDHSILHDISDALCRNTESSQKSEIKSE